jgi:hypothetical protein
MSINRCDICYHYVAMACQDTYEIETGLNEGETYTIVLEDHNGNIYMNDMVQPSGQPGNPVTISTSSFPAGMFNQWSGSYEIYFTDGGLDGEQQTLTFKDVTIV